MTDQKPAQIDVYKPKLFELYTRFRYNELICEELMRGMSDIERAVKWSTLVLVAISLITGSTESLNPRILQPAWAVITAFATLVSIYALVNSSGAKQFSWFRLAVEFRRSADDVEFFSELVALGQITEDKLLEKWKGYRDALNDLVERGGVELKDYDLKHKTELDHKIAARLKAEKKGG